MTNSITNFIKETLRQTSNAFERISLIEHLNAPRHAQYELLKQYPNLEKEI